MEHIKPTIRFILRTKQAMPTDPPNFFKDFLFRDERAVVFWGAGEESLTIIYDDHAEKIVYDEN